MRGVAVLLVVVHHAWPGSLPGGFLGVDVFFTLSGFVIGSLLLAEIDRTSAVNLYDFWTRRARRILPASLVVVATILGATWCWAPASERDDIGDDGLWATLFAANIRFIDQGVDYAASERDPSPFQHFWSLAVEEQFYLVIPLVFAVSVALATRHGWSARRLLGGAMVVVCVASLTYSVLLTSEHPTVAYFSPFTRAWQLAAGVVAACAAPVVARCAARWRDTLGLIGMLALAATVAAFDESGIAGIGYPSYLSVAPTLATVAVLLAGAGTPGLGARALAVAPLRRVGDVSYSLYLWHWPVLIIASWLVTTDAVVSGVLVVLAYGLAELTYRCVENPVRRSSWLARRRSVTALVAVSSIGMATACANQVGSFDARVAVRVTPTPVPPPSPAPAPHPAADRPETEFVPPAPRTRTGSPTLEIDADAVHADYPEIGQVGCQLGYTGSSRLPDTGTCTVGTGRRSIYLVGDSMATALFPAALLAATKHDARLTVMAKASCTLATGVTVHKRQVGGPYRSCDEFRSTLLEHLERTRPDAVIMVNSNGSAGHQVDEDGRQTDPYGWIDRAALGVVRTAERLEAAGIEVILVENPAKPGDPEHGTECLINGGTVEECSFDHTPSVGAYERAYRRLAGEVALVRVNTHVCPGNRCVPVLGDLVVWRDDSHFTSSYARTLAPAFARALRHTPR
ncbi:MAG: acyltransferase family protein [Aeromicrobium sp.]